MSAVGRETLVKIHVGAIPADATKNDLLYYFSKFGPVVDVLMSTRIRTRTSSVLNQGSCVLLVNDESTSTNILEASHFFRGRKIKCLKFLEGNALREHNRVNNERRLIVKNVPNHVSIGELKCYLKQHGEIEYLFFLKQKKYPCKLKTASVQYESPESTAAAINSQMHTVLGSKIKIHPYDRSYKKIKNSSHSLRPSQSSCKEQSSEEPCPISQQPFNCPKPCPTLPKLSDMDHFIKPTNKEYYLEQNRDGFKEDQSLCKEPKVRYNIKVRV